MHHVLSLRRGDGKREHDQHHSQHHDIRCANSDQITTNFSSIHESRQPDKGLVVRVLISLVLDLIAQVLHVLAGPTHGAAAGHGSDDRDAGADPEGSGDDVLHKVDVVFLDVCFGWMALAL